VQKKNEVEIADEAVLYTVISWPGNDVSMTEYDFIDIRLYTYKQHEGLGLY
jgi:hypothetical protein